MNEALSNLRPGSLTHQIAELNPGESISRIRSIDPTMTVARMPDEMPMIREQIRSVCQPAIRRAKEVVMGAKYTCEVGDVIMPGGTFYVVAVVTRTA